MYLGGFLSEDLWRCVRGGAQTRTFILATFFVKKNVALCQRT